MIIILEKEGVKRRVLVEDHIAQRDRIEAPAGMTRETYHRTGRTVDGHPVFAYRPSVRWVESKPGRIYQIEVGRFTLSVHRHIDHPAHLWLASCSGILCRHELKSLELEAAQQEALSLLRNILKTVLIDIEESKLCR